MVSHAIHQKRWNERHPEKVKELAQKRKIYKKQSRLKLLELLANGSPYCKNCGFTDVRALQLDHINGGGNDDRKRLGGSDVEITYYLKHLNEARETLQVLCANCNWVKKYENNEHAWSKK